MASAPRLRLIATMLSCALLPSVFAAQETLVVRSSVVLPPEIGKRLGEVNSRVSCGADGSITIALSDHPLNSPSPIGKLSSDGILLAQIDFAQVPGFEKGIVEDFAPGPHGETYVVGNALLGGTPETGLDYDPTLTLLRFDATGRLIARLALTRRIAHSRMAVFASGDALIVGLAVDGPHRGRSLAAIVSSEGVLLRESHLPQLLTDREPTYNAAHQAKTKSPMLIPMITDDDRIAILREGKTGALVYVSNTLEVSSVTRLKHPPGTSVRAPAVLGPDWLFAILDPPTPPRTRANYVRFNLQDGEIMATYPIPTTISGSGCKSSDGIQFFDIVHGTLNVMVPAANVVPGEPASRNQDEPAVKRAVGAGLCNCWGCGAHLGFGLLL